MAKEIDEVVEGSLTNLGNDDGVCYYPKNGYAGSCHKSGCWQFQSILSSGKPANRYRCFDHLPDQLKPIAKLMLAGSK